MPTAFITGTNRGIGLEFVRQYAAAGWKVIATCRNPIGVGELATLEGDIEVHGLDVSDPYQLDRLAKDLEGVGFDLLLNNAGIFGPKGYELADVDYQEWAKVMDINVFSPLKVSMAFLDNVAQSDQKKIVTVSSKMGSIADNTGGGNTIYRTSKAAVNSVMRGLAADLKDKQIAVRMVHPGWVRTDMGGDGADISAQESVTGMRSVIDGLTLSSTGKFYNYDGTELPW